MSSGRSMMLFSDLVTVFIITVMMFACCNAAETLRKISYKLSLVGVSKQTAFDATLNHLFVNGAGFPPRPEILAPGDSISGKGFKRLVRPVGLIEEILDSERSSYLTYTVRNPSRLAYPVTHHLGRFDFAAAVTDNQQESATESCNILWTVEYTPMNFSFNLAGIITTAVITSYLPSLAKHLNCLDFVMEEQTQA